jgi:YHS domain-containing protein
MKSLFMCLVLLIGFLAQAKNINNLTKEGIMLDGYDAVSYFKADKPVKGNVKYQAKLNGEIYLFSSEENKQIFLKDSKKYEPQFGGWCAYAVADSKSKVSIDPNSFLIQDGRLLLFYNGWLGDTRKKWQTTKDKTPAAFLKQSDTNWPEVQNKEP